MTPGQLNRWTLNQWWKVRMLAGWEHRVEHYHSTITAAHPNRLRVDRRVERSRVSVPSPARKHASLRRGGP